MRNRKFSSYLLCTVIAALGTIVATSVAAAQVADGPWIVALQNP
jgi:beta-glucosidase